MVIPQYYMEVGMIRFNDTTYVNSDKIEQNVPQFIEISHHCVITYQNQAQFISSPSGLSQTVP